MKFEGKGTPIGKRRRRRNPPDVAPADPVSKRARAGAEAGRKRAEDGRKRKDQKRADKAAASEGKPPREKPKAPQKKPNSKDVEQWFREGIWAMFGRKFVIPPWPANSNQRGLALKLLEDYGVRLTKDAVMLFCQTWDRRVRDSGGRLTGRPTINLLWGMREQIFGEVQTKDRKPEASATGKDSDEYREREGRPRIGWG